MLLLKIFLLWAFCHQTSQLFTPASLRALANYHTHRTRALSNALNLRARAHHNAAIARSRASSRGLYDRRIIRDSNNNSLSGEEQESEFDPELNKDFPDSWEHLTQETGSNFEGQGADGILLEQRDPLQVTDKDFIGWQRNTNEVDQELPCFIHRLREDANQGKLLQIPLGFGDSMDHSASTVPIDDEMARSASYERNIQGSSLEVSGECLSCAEMVRSQLDDYATKNSPIYTDTKLPFHQQSGYPLTNSAGPQEANVPNMHLPSRGDFQNSEQSVFTKYPTTLPRQGFSGDASVNTDGHLVEPQIRIQENDASPDFDDARRGKSADPVATHHLRPHGHVHTFSHSHFHGIQPLQPNMYTPTSQVITPAGVNLNVIQNQNAAIGPQFATSAIQPGFTTAIVNPGPVIHGGFGSNQNSNAQAGVLSQVTGHGSSITQAQTVQTHFSPIMPITQFQNIQTHSAPVHISQSQNINTQSANVMPNFQQPFLGPNIGGSSVVQTQTVHQGAREREPVDDIRMIKGDLLRERPVDFSDLEYVPEEMFQDAILREDGFKDEKVGTFLNSVPMEAPEFHSDPYQPENRQGIIKYIENEQENIKRFLHIIEDQYNYERANHEFQRTEPVRLRKTDENDKDQNPRQHNIANSLHVMKNPEESDDARLAEANFQNEEVGTINIDQIPEDFEEFETDLRRHWEAEEKTVKNMLDEIGENYRHNMDSLSKLINMDHQHLPYPTHYENSHDDDPNGHIKVQEVDIPDGDKTEKQDQHSHYPTHFQNSHDADRNGHIEVQEIDIPDGGKTEKQDQHLHYPTHFQNSHDDDWNGHIDVQDIDVPDGDKTEKQDHQHSPYPTHFQNFHDDDQNGQIEVQELDIPDGDKNYEQVNHHLLDEDVREAEKDISKSGKFQTSLDKNTQDRLGYIIQVPQRRYTDEYQRQARSYNQTTMAYLDKLLLKEKQLMNDLKKDAKHDKDMMMIGYIGDSLIQDLNNRLNKTREKREIGRVRSLPLRRLVTDPRAKIDMTKTLHNLGAVTRNAFEHEKAPLYHVRNMVGSVQNAMMAAMKIPTKNFLIPSAYDIVHTQGDNDQVGAINPSIFSRSGGQNLRNKPPIDGIMNTFQRVGSAIRGSVISGQEALNHVGDVANHAKNAVHSTRHVIPRLIILKNIPAVSKEPIKKAMLITPRIFDISAEDNQVGSTLGKQEPDFVKLGHILDAVGVSKPNYNMEFEKIVIEPRSAFADDDDLPEKPKIKHPRAFKDLLENIKIEKIRSVDDEDVVGNTLNTLDDVKSTVGANNLHDFIVQMRDKFKQLLDTTQTNRKAKDGKMDVQMARKIDRNQTPSKISKENGTARRSETQKENDNPNIKQQNPMSRQNRINNAEETVGVSLVPEEVLHPFMGQATLAQRQAFMQEREHTNKVGLALRPHKKFIRENNYEGGSSRETDQRQRDRDLGQILGAINPMMFERIFNETLNVNNTNNDTPHSVFHHHHNGRSHGHHHTKDESCEEEVGTSMAVRGQMLKPFMGQASGRLKQDFFQKYMPEEDAQENEDKEDSSEDTDEIETQPELKQWVDIFHPSNKHSVEYKE